MVDEGLVNLLDEGNLPGTLSTMCVAEALPKITSPLLFVGTRNGYLIMYSIANRKLCAEWQCSDVGLVSALATGDLLAMGRAVLCCITAEGHLTLFNIQQLNCEANGSGRYSVDTCFGQQILSNICSAIITDIDHDGRLELIVALTDRIIRTYRYSKHKPGTGGVDEGRLVALRKWEVPAQILSIAAGMNFCKEVQLIVTQPLNRFVRIKPGLQDNNSMSETGHDSSVDYVISGSDLNKQACVFLPRRLISCQMFHTLSPSVLIVDSDKMTPIACQQGVFTVTPINSYPDETLVATCDWDGTVLIFSMASLQYDSTVDNDTSCDSLPVNAPIFKVKLCKKLTGFEAFYDKQLRAFLFFVSNTYHDLFMFSCSVKNFGENVEM